MTRQRTPHSQVAHDGDRRVTNHAVPAVTGSLDWLEQLLSEDGVCTVDMRCIKRLERIWLHKIRYIKLESGRVVSIPDIFRLCGWWSE